MVFRADVSAVSRINALGYLYYMRCLACANECAFTAQRHRQDQACDPCKDVDCAGCTWKFCTPNPPSMGAFLLTARVPSAALQPSAENLPRGGSSWKVADREKPVWLVKRILPVLAAMVSAHRTGSSNRMQAMSVLLGLRQHPFHCGIMAP